MTVRTQMAGEAVPSVRAHSGLLQRKCACTGLTGSCEECDKKKLQKKSAHGEAQTSTIPPIVHDVLNAPGQPLDSETRAFMEPRFGHDFSHVRIHTDQKAAESARVVNALAYTVGRDIVFGTGQYGSFLAGGGRRLLAHELAHVVQQETATSGQVDTISHAGDPSELEADRAAEVVTSVGGAPSVNLLISSGTGWYSLMRQQPTTPQPKPPPIPEMPEGELLLPTKADMKLLAEAAVTRLDDLADRARSRGMIARVNLRLYPKDQKALMDTHRNFKQAHVREIFNDALSIYQSLGVEENDPLVEQVQKAFLRLLTKLRVAAEAALEVAKSVVLSQAGFSATAIADTEQSAYENNVELFARVTTTFSSAQGAAQPTAPATETLETGFPKEIQIGTETVKVSSKDEEKEARRIFKFVKSEFGIEIESGKTIQALQGKIKAEHLKAHVTQAAWDLSELRALEKGLSNFRDMLGKERAELSLVSTQRLTSVGRVTEGLAASGLSTSETIMGEYLSSVGAAALYNSAKTNAASKLADKGNIFEGVVVHEAAHSLFSGQVKFYVEGMKPPYWKEDLKTKNCTGREISTPQCTPSPEMPITDYGEKNAEEDLCEAVMFYYLERSTLKSQAPQRYDLVWQVIRRARPIKPSSP